MNDEIIDGYAHEQLALARKTYGNKNQILVCMEELNELACVLAKYPRYTDEKEATQDLYEKVLDEVADVTIILEHVKAIFSITDESLKARIDKKVARLSRWLLHSESMQETIDDRAVEEHHTNCDGCVRHGIVITEFEYANKCKPCYMAQATEGIAPFYEGESKQ